MKRLALLALLMSAPLHAQSAGKTGAQVLQFNAGARAASLSGAYMSARDADALFYNPAGIAQSLRGASVAYETFATDVVFGSAAGFTRLGSISLGASIAYLNAGDVKEVVPNPDFGGNTGTATGNTVSASENVLRFSAALPLRAGRLRVGASIGMVATSIAELSQNAPLGDLGLQLDVAAITFSAGLRNVGGSMSGASKDPLPTEARIGAAIPVFAAGPRMITIFADAISRPRESSIGFAGGIEAGITPHDPSNFGAALRAGFDSEANQLAPLRFGAGITLHSISLDYAFQSFDYLGAVHRLGLRWTR